MNTVGKQPKKAFTKPSVETVKFDANDVITTSGGNTRSECRLNGYKNHSDASCVQTQSVTGDTY